MKQFSSIDRNIAKNIRYVMFDIDDTITKNGKLLQESYDAMWAMHKNGIVVVPVTGRPAGWCDLIARQWPVTGVVGENGAFVYYVEDDGTECGKLERMYHPNSPDPVETKQKLQQLGKSALEAFPGLRIAKDQDYRIFDVALDFAEEEPKLELAFAEKVKAYCEQQGAIAKVSSIHVNAWYGQYDKLSMALYFLEQKFGFNKEKDLDKLVYFGDSPNDEPMFKFFPYSCGVANVCKYEKIMKNPPKYVSSKEFGYGFAEAADIILSCKK